MKFKSQNKTYEINTIILDLNGTLSVKGKVPKGVLPRIKKLKKLNYKLILFTGDQRGTAKAICKKLNIDYKITKTSKDKEREIKKLKPSTCAAIGNARIDISTFKLSKIAIATLQAEGIHTKVLKHIDLLVPTITEALDLFIDLDSMIATLKQ